MNLVDFSIKHNDKYIGIQVKSSILRKDINRYKFRTSRSYSYTYYPYKDVQIFALVASDIRRIYLVKNEEQKYLSLRKEDFFRFEDNKENFLNQIFSSLE